MPLAAPDLDAAFEACRRETAEWAKTFYLGTLLLPPAKRRAIWAIYVWCRRTDELMDSPEAQSRPVAELAERLDRWEEKTRALFNGTVENDLDAVMVDTLERFPQDIQPYLDMIEGQRMDLTWTRYPRFDDLKLYCYRVAGTVGLMTQGVIGVGVVLNAAGEVLIDQRLEEGLLGGMWEFPGGKQEQGETIETCIARELKEELGIAVTVGAELITVDHAYSHKKLRFVVHLCDWVSGEPQPLASQQVRWVRPDDLGNYAFPAANARIIEALLGRLESSAHP